MYKTFLNNTLLKFLTFPSLVPVRPNQKKLLTTDEILGAVSFASFLCPNANLLRRAHWYPLPLPGVAGFRLLRRRSSFLVRVCHYSLQGSLSVVCFSLSKQDSFKRSFCRSVKNKLVPTIQRTLSSCFARIHKQTSAHG